MTIQKYVQQIIDGFPGDARDIFNAQVMQTALGADVSDFMEQGRNMSPTYPRMPQGTKLQVVKGNLLKAATVYNAPGNKSRTVIENKMVTFEWGVDLAVIPYARIHEYGGQTGRNHAATMPMRPYIGPALTQFEKNTMPRLIQIFLERLFGGR